MENEKHLIEEMHSDLKEICGGVSNNTSGIVDSIVNHLLRSHPSAEFLHLMKEYKDSLWANAECAASQQFFQRIRSTEKRREGIYFLEDGWGNLVKSWLENNSSEIPVVESLDDVYNDFPKGKPTKKWTGKVDNLFVRFSEVRVLYVLRSLLNILVESDEVLKKGICSDNERKLKSMVHILNHKKYEEDAELLRKLAVVSYSKIPYSGPISTGVGNVCLQALSDLDGTQGLVHLSELARKLKYPASAATLAKKRLGEAAREKGVNVQDLESMVVPDYGLKD